MAVRAKFQCQQVIEAKYTRTMDYSQRPAVRLPEPVTEKSQEIVTLSAVHSNDPDDPNHAFWKATPSAMLTMYVDNPEAWGTFEAGKQYLVDFTPAS